MSVGGISESTQKYSTEALYDYIFKDVETRLPRLLDSAFELLQNHAKDERIINPLFKTLSLIMEREEVQQCSKIGDYISRLFEAVRAEIKGLESIKKVPPRNSNIGL